VLVIADAVVEVDAVVVAAGDVPVGAGVGASGCGQHGM
jgi:hypothetical protein